MLKDNEKVSIKQRFHKWSTRHRRIILVVSAILLVSLIATATCFALFINKPATKHANVATKRVATIKYYSPLTGEQVSSQDKTKLPVTAVMIENSLNARPQSGLKQAGVVFEAIAEGGITRFMAIYQQEKPSMIGPVRSIRLYDVEWAAAFDASIAHVGGSAAALNEVRNGSYRDIDEFFNSGSYWRASDRYAPHNVYTSSAKLDTLNTSKGYSTSTFTGFPRADGKMIAKPTATTINITISSATYNSVYTYNQTSNNYLRFQAGEAHLDREDGQITPKVIVAMYVSESTVLQDGYREDMATSGSGKAVIFQNGNAIEGTWTKASKASQIAFTDSSGNQIALDRGQTWIVALPNDGRGNATWAN